MKAKITIEVFYIKFLSVFMKIQGIIINFYVKFLLVFYENPRNYHKFLFKVSFGFL